MAIDYFVQNPDVAAAYRANSYGLTPELFAGYHFIKYGGKEGRNATPEVAAIVADIASKPVDTSATDVQGDIGATSNNLGAGLLGASAVAAPLSQEEIVTKIKNQILAQGTSSQWTGQGLGSPEKNAADMARLLSDAGITDINQFGKVPVFAPVEPIKILYNGKQVFTETDEAGKTSSYIYEPTGKILTGSYGDGGDYTSPEMRLVTVPKDAKLETVYGVARDSGGEGGSYYEPIDPSKIKTVDGKLVGDTGQTTFGNKLTGTAIANNYETGADAFGGTFAGKGKTGYRVQFAPDGTPVFYTGGESSSEFKQYAPLLAIASLGLAAPSLFAAGAPTAGGAAGLSALDAGLGVYGTGGTAAGLGAAGLGSLTAGFTPAQIAASDALLSGSGLLGGSLTAGLTAADIAALEAGLPTSGSLTSGLTAAQIAAGEAALPGAGLGAASLLGGASSVLGGGGATLPAAVTNAITNAGVGSVVNSVLGGGANVSNLLSGGLGTAGNLLQMQESKEAAQRAQARIDAETAAAKVSAAFRPVGMTTRFGTSQFQVDPVTGQLTSAGYTLSPEAKAQQDRFMALSNAGLTQAEQAPTQFAPLKTGAERLFGLGNEYLAQTPEQVAQNYLAQQMKLLAPSREIELANLQTRLRNQGRIGLSVAQGGTLGATTPELQALYNARATQEAQLAANAQQAGQQQVAFGAGLLGTGAQTMGQYYGGQQAAYAPYTTAMGQVQGLEALGQQPLTMGAQLGQTASTAGARSGQLGLEGARLSTALATSADATRNLGAQSLIAAGNPNSQFGSAIGGLLGGGLQSAFSGTGLGSSGFGTGLAYGNQDLGLFL